MEPYKEMYYELFNAVTDSIRQLVEQKPENALITLMNAQRKTEERYLEAGD